MPASALASIVPPLLSTLLSGFGAGSVCVLAPDHFAVALSLSLTSVRNWRSAFTIGCQWGIGHSTGIVFVLTVVFLLRASVAESVFGSVVRVSQLAIGMILLLLGLLHFWNEDAYFAESRKKEDDIYLDVEGGVYLDVEELGGVVGLTRNSGSLANAEDVEKQAKNSGGQEEEGAQVLDVAQVDKPVSTAAHDHERASNSCSSSTSTTAEILSPLASEDTSKVVQTSSGSSTSKSNPLLASSSSSASSRGGTIGGRGALSGILGTHTHVDKHLDDCACCAWTRWGQLRKYFRSSRDKWSQSESPGTKMRTTPIIATKNDTSSVTPARAADEANREQQPLYLKAGEERTERRRPRSTTSSAPASERKRTSSPTAFIDGVPTTSSTSTSQAPPETAETSKTTPVDDPDIFVCEEVEASPAPPASAVVREREGRQALLSPTSLLVLPPSPDDDLLFDGDVEAEDDELIVEEIEEEQTQASSIGSVKGSAPFAFTGAPVTKKKAPLSSFPGDEDLDGLCCDPVSSSEDDELNKAENERMKEQTDEGEAFQATAQIRIVLDDESVAHPRRIVDEQPAQRIAQLDDPSLLTPARQRASGPLTSIRALTPARNDLVMKGFSQGHGADAEEGDLVLENLRRHQQDDEPPPSSAKEETPDPGTTALALQTPKEDKKLHQSPSGTPTSTCVPDSSPPGSAIRPLRERLDFWSSPLQLFTTSTSSALKHATTEEGSHVFVGAGEFELTEMAGVWQVPSSTCPAIDLEAARPLGDRDDKHHDDRHDEINGVLTTIAPISWLFSGANRHSLTTTIKGRAMVCLGFLQGFSCPSNLVSFLILSKRLSVLESMLFVLAYTSSSCILMGAFCHILRLCILLEHEASFQERQETLESQRKMERRKRNIYRFGCILLCVAGTVFLLESLFGIHVLDALGLHNHEHEHDHRGEDEGGFYHAQGHEDEHEDHVGAGHADHASSGGQGHADHASSGGHEDLHYRHPEHDKHVPHYGESDDVGAPDLQGDLKK
ncbi:unnamed protein product [Amoebophrya sp. A25]|nr:unnamed protein product [Amoebophrya sp. A25]|eukprot:GSA25T00023070001.1